MRHAVLKTETVVVTGRFHGAVEACSLEVNSDRVLEHFDPFEPIRVVLRWVRCGSLTAEPCFNL